MILYEALQLAKNAGPAPRKIFITSQDWAQLWLDLLRNHPEKFPQGQPRWMTNLKVDNLHIFSAETNDMSIVREANRLADQDNRRVHASS